MSKQALSETDIRTKYITPAVVHAGWDLLNQIREEVSFTTFSTQLHPHPALILSDVNR
jgi:type I site-specific restriction endonuclease